MIYDDYLMTGIGPMDDVGYDESILRALMMIALYFVCFMLGIVLCGLFGSCTTTRYVPIETVKTERVTEHDSVLVEIVKHDSVNVEKRGDTVFVNRWHIRYKDRWRDRWRDSVRVDSVQVPVPVERKLNRWEKFCLDYGKVMTGVTVVGVVLSAIAVLRWIRRRGRR